MTLKQIFEMPQVMDSAQKVHESVFRSYHILDKVMEMVIRGDSKETIIEVVNFLNQIEKYEV